jgi:hypothetical protein
MYAEIGTKFVVVVYLLFLFWVLMTNDDMDMSTGCMFLGFFGALASGILFNHWSVILFIATFTAGIISGLVYHYTNRTLLEHFTDWIYTVKNRRQS